MTFRRAAFLLVLAVFPVTHAWADDRELYHAEVCNAGQRTVDVAVAYHDWGFGLDPYWIIDRWWVVKPGACKTVFSHFYAPNNLLSYQSFPLHLAFAFTDSTGVWGAAKVPPPGNVAASRVLLCVDRDDLKYRVDAKNPQADCPKGVLIPASIDWEPENGASYSEYGGYGSPMRFTVSIGASDRAIPLGPRGPASFTVTEKNAPNHEDFARVLGSAMDALPEREETQGPDGSVQLKPGYRWVNVCAEKSVVYKGSMSNLQTARAKALTDAIERFLPSHAATRLRIRITEQDGVFSVRAIGGKGGDCVHAGESEFVFQSPEHFGLVPQ